MNLSIFMLLRAYFINTPLADLLVFVENIRKLKISVPFSLVLATHPSTDLRRHSVHDVSRQQGSGCWVLRSLQSKPDAVRPFVRTLPSRDATLWLRKLLPIDILALTPSAFEFPHYNALWEKSSPWKPVRFTQLSSVSSEEAWDYMPLR